MLSPQDALTRLKQGNQRFIAGQRTRRDWPEHRSGGAYRKAQRPFAVVLGCSDSRVPPELIFDQSIGDIFTVRVAGNTAAPPALGSIEYAVLNLHAPLVLVLGHSQCGAVSATIDALCEQQQLPSSNLDAIVEPIYPVVSGIQRRNASAGKEELLERAVGENVRHVITRLADESEILSERVRSGVLIIAGAEYSLDTGRVSFFD